MKRSFFALSCWLLAPAAFAILDTNNNGFSDLWERDFNNGSLFDQSFDPHSDDDSDGWTNAQEAGAGTSPFDPNPPDGIIRPDIVHTPDVMGEENGVPYIETPEAVTVTWPTIPGKRYHLLVSPDLSQGSWIEVPDSDFIGNGNIPEFHFTTAESDKLFWRVAVEDIDMDSDGLTNHEEILVGTNPTLTDTDGDTLSDHAELVAGTDALQADGDGDGWTDAQELAAGTDSSYQDTDGDGIPDSIDTQPLVSALAFADADGDGIPDGNDSNSNDPRGPAPSIASGTASGNPLSDLIEDEIVKFALTVNNPAGAAPTASNLSFFLNGIAETDTATITAIGSPVGSSQRFLLTWKAKTTASYPTLSLQNLTLRFRDSQQATSWFLLARIDVAEWEGMVAGLRAGPPSGGWEASIQSHSGGLKSPASYLAGMNGGHALWYRGARNMEIHNSPGPAIFAMIGEGVRYPMIFISQVGSGPLALHSVADISSAETIPYLGVWVFNDWSESIRISGTGFGCTVPPGGNVYEAMPERTENGNSYVHVEIHRLTAVGERMMTDTNWPIYIAQAPARRMTTINFEAGGQGRAKFTAVDCWMPVGAQIAPYTAGTPELPGLPLPGDSHTDSTDSALLPIAQGVCHKIILKVGPDAAALSNGIGLWLRKGENGDAAPQGAFMLKVAGGNGTLEDLTVPADGKITFAANSQNWQRLTSPEGLTLFMSRDENVDEIHDLSLQLLKKHEWYAQEAVRIASIDLLPVEVEQEGYTSEKGIRFCRWHDAFTGGLLDPEFADKDRDRFRIKIPGILPNLTKIKIKSTGLHGAVIDGAVVAKATDGDYEVEMKQENGAMVSTWMLLVSDGDDDKGYNGKGTDDGKDDQTLLADFESIISVTLPEFDNAEFEFTAQKPLGNITLDTIYLSPTGDVPQAMQDLIHKQVAKMQEIYHQIGVRVAWASIEGVAIPQSWLDAVPNPDPTKPDIEPADRLNASECQSARVLVRNRQVPANHIRIGYINALMRPDLWLPDRTALGFTDDGTDGIMVSLEPNEARFVLGVTAHEVGHTLGIDHVEPSDFLMKSPMRWENSRRDSKRFEEGDFNTIKTKEAFYVPIQ